MNNTSFERRRFLKSSAFSLIGITTFAYAPGREIYTGTNDYHYNEEPFFYRYPSTNDALAQQEGQKSPEEELIKGILGTIFK